MALTITDNDIKKMISQTIQEDINKELDSAVEKLVDELRNKIRRNVAVRIIQFCASDYDMRYCQDQLLIRVQIK